MDEVDRKLISQLQADGLATLEKLGEDNWLHEYGDHSRCPHHIHYFPLFFHMFSLPYISA
ncbi:MAG: hypothetical protein ACUVQY_11240 [Thermoproteota archaeon]